MKRNEQELRDRDMAYHQLHTCRFAVHYPANNMFGEIDDCKALIKPFCKLEGKPCPFYKAEDNDD